MYEKYGNNKIYSFNFDECHVKHVNVCMKAVCRNALCICYIVIVIVLHLSILHTLINWWLIRSYITFPKLPDWFISHVPQKIFGRKATN